MKDNFLERMNSRLAERGIKGRQDLELHDAKVIDAGRAVKVLAGYSPLYGPPSVHDVTHWVQSRMAEFGQDVMTRPDTISVYPEKNFVTFVVEQKQARQPLAAAKGMTRAGVDQYLDSEGKLWEVVKAEQGGSSYILRRDGVSIEQMLSVRKQALRGGLVSPGGVSARKNVTLASLDSIPSAGGGYANVEVGDVVDFYANSLIHRGQVKSAGVGGVKIQVLNGSDTFTVDPQAITNVIEKSPAASKEQDDAIRRYFSLVYPGNPEMTEIISPNSSAPIKDNRPHDELEIQPIETSLEGSATPRVTTRPTERVLGKLPGTRAQTSGKPAAKR
jgi:hypothetical protein